MGGSIICVVDNATKCILQTCHKNTNLVASQIFPLY